MSGKKKRDAKEETCPARGYAWCGFSLLLASSSSSFFGPCLVLACPEGFFRAGVGTARAVSSPGSSCLLQLVFTERNSQETLGFGWKFSP